MGRPKALLPYRGVTFLEQILNTIDSSALEHVVVVLGRDREAISRRVELPSWIYNEDHEQGMTTSFQAGIRALPKGTMTAMLFLVDHPLVAARTIDQLLERALEKAIVVPVHQGRRGHPVLFSKEALEEVLRLPASRGADTVVRADPDRVIEVAIEDSGILVDIDTPALFERWARK